jgi:hypothetical protein
VIISKYPKKSKNREGKNSEKLVGRREEWGKNREKLAGRREKWEE